MSKLFVFGGLWWLLGNPFLAILVLLVVLYLLERRFIGLSPSIVRPFKRRSAITRLKRTVAMSPFDVSAKSELAHLLIEQKKYSAAHAILLGMEDQMDHSAEYWSDRGICELALGHLEAGKTAMEQAIAISPRVKYGQPYLRMAEAFAKRLPDQAIGYLEQFKQLNASSCEAWFRLGEIYRFLGKPSEATEAYRACKQLYGTLPRYLKRHERKWVLRSLLRGGI